MNYLKITFYSILVLVVAGLGWMVYQRFAVKPIDPSKLPQFIQADWIDLSRIGTISKFRSGAGHDFSGNGETCRSMKHYFNAIRTEVDQKLVVQYQGFSPPFSLEGAIPIYSPVEGKIVGVEEENSRMGKQIYIRPTSQPNFTVRLFHIFLLDGYAKGRAVKAGEQIGWIGRIQNTDIAVSLGSMGGRRFVSYFQVMPDSVLAKYQALGVQSREELIISKEYRDAHPLSCQGEQFSQNYDSQADPSVHFVKLDQVSP